MVNPSDAYAYFKEKAGEYKRYGYDVVRERKVFLEWTGLSNGPVLEIGTGRGYFTACLSELNLPVVSVDLDKDMLDFAQAFLFAWAGRSDMANTDVEFVRAPSPYSFPFADNSFSAIVSFNMWHHVEDSYALLPEINRLLKDKGTLLLADFSDKGFDLVSRLHLKNYGEPHLVLRRGFRDVRDFFKLPFQEYHSEYEEGIKLVKR